jgi:hypothetical protein
MQRIRSLLRYQTDNRKQKIEEQSKITLLGLPREIILLLIAYLPIHSKVLLSQTFTALRNSLRPICITAENNLSRPEYWSFLSSIVDDLLLVNRSVCTACDGLHTTDVLDAPDASSNMHRLCSTDYAAIGNMTFYCLKQRHIQLAIRYFRTGMQQQHLARLLSPYSATSITEVQRPRISHFNIPQILTLHNYHDIFVLLLQYTSSRVQLEKTPKCSLKISIVKGIPRFLIPLPSISLDFCKLYIRNICKSLVMQNYDKALIRMAGRSYREACKSQRQGSATCINGSG